MDILGVGPLEILMILVVATLIFGPNRIPEFARKAGEFLRTFRSITTQMTKEFTKAIDSAPTKPTTPIKPPDPEIKQE